MRSATPKVLHRIGGLSLLGHAMAAASSLHPHRLVVVVRHERDRVAGHVAELDPDAVIADQDETKGTGRAVQCGLDAIAADGPPTGTIVVTYGDVPLLTGDTLATLLTRHTTDGNAVTVLTAHVPDPTGYGRVLRQGDASGGSDDSDGAEGSGGDGSVLAIVEHKDADESQRAVTEINSGIYAFDAAVLTSALARITTDNAQGEMYLTDVLAIARADGGRIGGMVTDDVMQVEGVNDRVQLATLGGELNRRLLTGWMRAGVTVVDPATTWVDVGVRLARDVTLLPGTHLHGSTEVAEGATIGPDTTLTDCVVGPGARVLRSHATSSVVGQDATVGPFSHLRPGTRLGPGGTIGEFVGTKNAVIGAGSTVPHLSHVGDATIGEGSNIGAGTVFVNDDGMATHRTTVGDHVRIGSDTMLIAPVTVGDGAYTAAGSVVTEDVPPGAMAVARARQRNIAGWVSDRRPGTASAGAADAARATTARGHGDSSGQQ